MTKITKQANFTAIKFTTVKFAYMTTKNSPLLGLEHTNGVNYNGIERNYPIGYPQ